MPKDVFVRIRGDDDLSPELKKVAAAAKEAGAGLKEMDSSAKSAGESAASAGRDLSQMSKDAKEVGQAIGVLVGGLALAGQSFRDQEVALRGLERAYGDSSDEMEAFAEQIQDTTNFSNDAAVASANIAATLARNYGFTADEIQRVLQISADLAASYGIGLEDATYRVTAALRGEAEAAEAIGLTMNQAAIDHDNLTLSMSNQEAGHFRLNALIEQSAFATGAAAEQADTFYGSMTDLGHGIQDAAQSVGDWLGPLGELGAYAADNAIQIAAMGLALGQLGQGAAALNNISKAMTGVGLASQALTLLPALLTGPAGIVIALTAAGLAVSQFAGNIGPEFHQASGEAVEAVDALIAKVVELGDTSALAETVLGLDTISAEYQKINDEANQATGAIGDWIAQAAVMDDANAETVEGLMLASAEFDNLTAHQREVIDANSDGVATLEELTNAQAQFNEEAIHSQAVLDGLQSGADELAQIFAMTGEGAAFAKAEANTYTEALLAGKMSAEDYEKALQQLVVGYNNIREDSLAAGESMETQTAATTDATTALEAYIDAQNNIGGQNIAGEHREAAEAMQMEALSADALADNLARIADLRGGMPGMPADRPNVDDGSFDANFQGVKAQAQEYAAAQRDLSAAIGDTIANSATLFGVNTDLIESFDSTANIVEAAAAYRTMREEMVSIATSMPDAAEVMDAVFQSIVGNTNQIASSSSAIAEWATGFTDASEGASKLDSILVGVNNGLSAATITQGEYNAAMDAFTTIGQENAEIQQNIAVIQAKQAPLIAEQVEMTENYTQAIAEMGVEQQAVALGFMDSAQAGKALELQTLAISAAAGDLGAGGQEFASNIITGAAQADGQLRLMLESMGLITTMPDGTIVVNFEDNATSPLQQLQQTMEQLAYTQILISVDGDIEAANAAFEEIFGHAAEWDSTDVTATLGADNSAALARTEEAQSGVDTFGRSTGTATISVNDNASGVIQGAINLIGDFASRSSSATITTYVNTVYQTFGSPGTRLQTGGIVHRAGGGGIYEEPIPFIGGEAGFELVKRAGGGGMAVLPSRGVYQGQQGDMVFNNEASKSMVAAGALGGLTVTIPIYGDVIGEDGFAERMADRVAQALEVAVQRRHSGYNLQ